MMADKQTKFEALVHALHKDIYRYAYWLVRDPHIAEDLVQETFLRAWKGIDSLQDDQAAKGWLITILRRENVRRFERKQFDLVDLDDHPQSQPGALHSEEVMDFKCDELILGKKDADSRALTRHFYSRDRSCTGSLAATN